MGGPERCQSGADGERGRKEDVCGKRKKAFPPLHFFSLFSPPRSYPVSAWAFSPFPSSSFSSRRMGAGRAPRRRQLGMFVCVLAYPLCVVACWIDRRAAAAACFSGRVRSQSEGTRTRRAAARCPRIGSRNQEVRKHEKEKKHPRVISLK